MCVTVDHARAVGSKPFLGHRRAKTVRLKITGEKKGNEPQQTLC